MSKQYKVCVLGAGAFGTAMAHSAAANPIISKVQIYARNQEVVDSINQHGKNPKFFSEFKLSPKISSSSDVKEVLQDSAFILSCIPVQQVRPFLKENKQYFNSQVPFVSCSKGIIVETGQLISQVVKEELPGVGYGILSGPSFAEEIMKEFPTAVVVASENDRVSKLVQFGVQNQFFRIFTQKDVIGVELAGALKNVLAIGTGIIEGAGYGYNTQTAFLARGAREMQVYARAFGADKHTFYGLAGVGDLMLTSFGKLSRNRSFGVKIGQGEKIEDIIKNSKGVVEGVPTLELVYNTAEKLHLDIPLTKTIYQLVKGKIRMEEALKTIMVMKIQEEFPPTFEDLVG